MAEEKAMRIIQNKGKGPHNLGQVRLIEGFNYIKNPDHLEYLKKYEKRIKDAPDLYEHKTKAASNEAIPVEKALGYIKETNSYKTLKAWMDTDKRPEIQGAIKKRMDEEQHLQDQAANEAKEEQMRRRAGM